MNPSHQGYEPFELSENMQEDLGLFEAAAHARHLVLPRLQIHNILAALDGSNQEPTTRQIAEFLADRWKAELHSRSGLKQTEEICEATRSVNADLAVIPVPFRENIDELTSQSLGSAMDRLLESCSCPLLCVRQPMDESSVSRLFSRILMPSAIPDENAERALGWSCFLAGGGGELLLLELAGEIPQTREGAQGIDASRIMAERMGTLVAAGQRTAAEQGFGMRTELRTGSLVSTTLAMIAESQSTLVIVGRASDPTSPHFHFVVDLLKRLRCPMLLV